MSPLEDVRVPQARLVPLSQANLLVLVGESVLGTYAAPEGSCGLKFSPVYPVYSIDEVSRVFNPRLYKNVRFSPGLV